MKLELSLSDNLKTSVNNIEVQIIYSANGAPYCEFTSLHEQLVKDCIVHGSTSNIGYFYIDSGYAESFPLFE